MFQNRIEAFLGKIDADCLFITSPENLRYFSGFTGGEATLLVTKTERLLYTDSRYLIQAAEEAPDFQVIDIAGVRASDGLKERNPHSVAFEGACVSADEFLGLQEKLPEATWQSVSRDILVQRSVKDRTELDFTRRAAKLADDAFSHVLPFIKPGVTEKDVAMELEWYMRKNGASGPSFPIVCASGVRSAMPHGVATDKKLESGDFLTMDFGCLIEGYASDMTRTVVLGKATEEQKRIYETVKIAQETALTVVRAGISGKIADAAARDIIKEAGYGQYFGHALGHGTGLEIHEQPVLSPRSETILEPNMLVTVEPGVYVENLGGVRIEDLVIVTEKGIENLTSSTKELLEL